MPINRLVILQDQISRMENSYNELNKFSSYASEKSEGREIQDLKGKIVLEDAFFQYPEQKNPIFESLNLKVSGRNCCNCRQQWIRKINTY